MGAFNVHLAGLFKGEVKLYSGTRHVGTLWIGGEMAFGVACGICEQEGDRGPFEGQHTADTDGDTDAWVWRFKRGEMVFVSGRAEDVSIPLDAYVLMPYCDCCGQVLRQDRGLELSAPLAAYVL